MSNSDIIIIVSFEVIAIVKPPVVCSDQLIIPRSTIGKQHCCE